MFWIKTVCFSIITYRYNRLSIKNYEKTMFIYNEYSVVESLAKNPYRKFARGKMSKNWYEEKIKKTSNQHEVGVWRSEMNDHYPPQK